MEAANLGALARSPDALATALTDLAAVPGFVPSIDEWALLALEVRDGRARCVPTTADVDVHTDLSVLGSLYFGAHRASAFATAGRLRCANPRQVAALDAAFASDVPAQLGFGF